MLLAIDPGTDTGWALFSDSSDRDDRYRLIACGLGDPRLSDRHRIADITRVVIERPMIYPRGQTKNPNDVLSVAVNAGEWGGLYRQWATIEYVLPFQWKGSVPKAIHHERVLAKLSDAERAVVDQAMARGRSDASQAQAKRVARGKRHNVLDAVGLGLFGVGR
jgi:hypothetical protein